MTRSVPEVMKAFRYSAKLSQQEMANLLNVSQATYHNWETGKYKVPLEAYPSIATCCGISLTDLLPPGFWKAE
ncbi:helix-turn-helix transcriptional regulator [Arundinibacter roseus]|uniref:XRE family transcriptional regulator n=1 Tax=Arundinibacter roseus TaxID=2070510 RepID=A0A4R4JTU0_9BACT|nr:helix-turn-helix transcriptional regulator [Arundinibacter roseus]TDB57953.1 XRE family transcriptional regulator [Arundinibacter roseus]